MADAQLPTARLGSAGPEITLLGFGARAIGGGDWAYGWGPQDDRDSIAAIRHALDRGVDWIDTAAAYGLGHSEEVVAPALEGVSDRPEVFTKCGMGWREGGDRVPRPNLRPEELRRECEDSLRRLGVETLDLLQFHWPDSVTGTPVEESWGAMADLVAEGKVRRAGVSNFDRDLLERCEPILHVDSLQPPFNPVQRDAAGLLAWCADHGTGVIVYSPMLSGQSQSRMGLRPTGKRELLRFAPRIPYQRPAASPTSGWRAWTAATGAAGSPSSRSRRCRATWRWPRPSGGWESATAPAPARSRSPGPSPGRE